MRQAVVLVVAKAPVSGRVKTRLGRVVGMERAAQLAAAALLDTLAVCAAAYGVGRCHLALDGDLEQAELADELLAAVAGWTVHTQRGAGLGSRLVNAHEDAASASGTPVVQVGMDTPHLDARTLTAVGARLTHRDEAVLGPAADGGWWLLGVGGPHLLGHLGEVPMSTARTGDLTREALQRAGARVSDVETLRDVDELADARAVASAAPGTRFARAFVRTAG
jgi:rSAM/selenodomain-associated transferase 1